MQRLSSSTSKYVFGRAGTRWFASTSRVGTNHPNAPLELDPSLRSLLRDVDISLANHKAHSRPSMHHLEVVPTFSSGEDAEPSLSNDSYEPMEDMSRKSPAARFGSQGVGAVVLPVQLQHAINAIISESDKTQLHSDAKRLFQSDTAGHTPDGEWAAQYNVRYHSRRQEARHHERDGIAFASVALPAHYSAIYSVLGHVRHRLGPSWTVRHVIDWGAGSGSGLWATSHAFQQQFALHSPTEDLSVENSTLASYCGIDKRAGLISIGKKMLRNVNTGMLDISWQKAFQESTKRHCDGHETLGISAFALSALPSDLARKALVKEMWESGAHVLVLIDHNTPAGYEAIAGAREYVLKQGKKEVEHEDLDRSAVHDCHVVAPCPHDAACPLYRPGAGSLVCGFSQRLQRPAFVRRTKHSGIGHEDIEYSYVVIRRGARPTTEPTQLGRIGEVGRRELEDAAKSQVKLKELQLHDGDDAVPSIRESIPAEEEASTSSPSLTAEQLNEVLRQEAFQWPRLVFPPLKRPGHIILDSCTAEGKIMRLTIPKSQGKQPYYDARKSNWGDIFPHPPKNSPQVRSLARAEGSDIGKRRDFDHKKEPVTYQGIAKEKKDRRKKSRRDST